MTIAGWDNSNCIWAIAPNWLRLGANPAPFHSGAFPLYRGPSAGGSETATLANMTEGDGYVDGELLFDGVDDYVATNYNPAYTDAGSWTFEAWFWFVSGSGATKVFIGHRDDADNQVWFSADNADKPYLRFESGNVADFAFSNTALTTGLKHYVGVKPGTNPIRLYLNGGEVAVYGQQDSYGLGSFQLTEDINVGRAGGMLPFPGSMHYAAMYDTALTPARIAANYALGPWMGGIHGTNATPMVLSVPSIDMHHYTKNIG